NEQGLRIRPPQPPSKSTSAHLTAWWTLRTRASQPCSLATSLRAELTLQRVQQRRDGERSSGGYNAAVLAELVGPGGSVTTLDIDPEVADRARARLAAAGYRRVRVLCADGEF